MNVYSCYGPILEYARHSALGSGGRDAMGGKKASKEELREALGVLGLIVVGVAGTPVLVDGLFSAPAVSPEIASTAASAGSAACADGDCTNEIVAATNTMQEAVELMGKRFGMNDLKNLAFDLGFDTEEVLSGMYKKSDYIRALLQDIEALGPEGMQEALDGIIDFANRTFSNPEILEEFLKTFGG